jgi:hypothetical protein
VKNRYIVNLSVDCYFNVHIDADSEEEAERLALRSWSNDQLIINDIKVDAVNLIRKSDHAVGI